MFEASRGCHLYFDLDGRSAGSISCESIACCVAEEAAGVLRDLIAARAPAHIADGVMIETLTIESAHGGDKFSQHVLLQVMRSGGCYDEPCCLLAGLAAAHDVAARVVARCEQRGVPASTLVDFAVYRAGGCLRLLGSSKLAGDARAPLRLAVAHSAPGFASLEPRELLLASLVQPGRGSGAFPLTGGSGAPARTPRCSPTTPRDAAVLPSTVATATVPRAANVPTHSTGAAVPHVRWRHLTARPLLEMPRLVPRELGAPRRGGRGAPPPPLRQLARWGAAKLRLLGCRPRGGGLAAAGPGAVISSWQVSVLEREHGVIERTQGGRFF